MGKHGLKRDDGLLPERELTALCISEVRLKKGTANWNLQCYVSAGLEVNADWLAEHCLFLAYPELL